MRTLSPMGATRTVTILLLLGLPACGHPVQRKLEGRWLGDSVENFDTGDLAAITGWVRGVTFEFSGSNLTVAVPAEEARTGKYKVTSANESGVSLAVQRPDGKTDKVALKLDDERSIRWMVGEGRAVVLRRER